MPGTGHEPHELIGRGSITVRGAEAVEIFSGDPEAAAQATWFIDPVNGDDEASGLTALTPIKTHQVMMDRLGDQIVNIPSVVVTLMGDSGNFGQDNPVRGKWRLGISGGVTTKLTYVAQKTLTTLYSGAFNAVTSINAPTNQTQYVADTSSTFPTGMLNTATGNAIRVRLTSGANAGAFGYPVTTPAASTAETGPFMIPDQSMPVSSTPPATVSPAALETFVVETGLLQIADFNLEIESSAILSPTANNATFALFKDLQLYATGAVALTRPQISGVAAHGAPPEIIFSGCDVGQLQPNGVSIGLVNCLCSQTEIDYGQIQVRGGVVRGTMVLQGAATRSQFLSDCLFAGSLGGKLTVEVGGIVLQRVAFTDAVGGAGVGDGLLIRTGCNVMCQAIQGVNEAVYGDGNAQYGVHCQASASLSYQNVKPTVTGTAGDASVGGTTRTWAQIPYFNGYDGVTVGTGNGAFVGLRS